MDECLFMNFGRFVTATSCYCCYSICFVRSAAISAPMVVTFRNTQARGVHGSKLRFIQLLYSYDYWLSQKKKKSMDSGKTQTISDCLFGKQTVLLYVLHLTAKTPEVRGLTGPGQSVAEGDRRCYLPALLSPKRQWYSRTRALRPTGTRVCMLAFCVHFHAFGFSWHLYDPKAWEELSIS